MLDLGELTLDNDISASPLLDLVIFRDNATGVVVEEFTKLVDITANQTLFSFFFLSFLICCCFFLKLIIGHYFTTLMMNLGWGKKKQICSDALDIHQYDL